GLEVDALHRAPDVHSARYAAPDLLNQQPHEAGANTNDDANNARLLRELEGVPHDQRSGRFVCVLAAARDGKTLATFRGKAEGRISRPLQRVQESSRERSLTRLNCAEFGMTPRIRRQAIKLSL